jgi:hypothetical protein
MTPVVPEVVSWPLEPETVSPFSSIDFERGGELWALRRSALQPGLLSGLPWLAVCVLAVVAWPIGGQGMSLAFLLMGFIGLVALFAVRFAEWGVSVLHLWDRRQAARRKLGLSGAPTRPPRD